MEEEKESPSAATEGLENYCLHRCKDRSPGCPENPDLECANYMMRVKANTRVKAWACTLLILATAVLVVWLWWIGLPQQRVEEPNQKCVRSSDSFSSEDTAHNEW